MKVLLLLVASVSALLPDPPKVSVPPNILRHWGVTENPNVPGLFNKLMKNVTAGNTLQQMQEPGSQVIMIVNGESLSVQQLFKFLLSSPIPDHAQFAVAHILNIYYRLYNATTDFNKNLTSSLTKYRVATDSVAVNLCKRDVFLHQIMRQYTFDVNIASACLTFQRLLSRPLIVSKMISDVSFAQQSLDVQDTLLGGPVKIGDVKIFMLTAPNLPTLFQSLYQRELTTLFKDYIQFISKIETSNEGEREMKMLLTLVRKVLESNLKSFWDTSRNLAV